MRLALYGGTFDPIHWGHLLCAETACEAFKLDRVLFVPAAQSPMKATPAASAERRLAMVRAAIHGNPRFGVDTWELNQKRPVFTQETLRHFKKRFPKAQLFFMLGSDSLASIDRWQGGRGLLKEATFLVADRATHAWTKIPLAIRSAVRGIPNPAVAIASHEIRARVAKKKSIRYHVPESVRTYIQRHRLYA